jgi:ABC-type sugar transport system ATPase subunit
MMRDFELENINFSLEGEQSFFRNISLTFQAGKIHCISGDNGIGKSTFFRVIHGKIKKSEQVSGTYILDTLRYDCVHNSIPETFSMHVKLFSQHIDSLLVKKMTVAENMRLAQLADQPFLDRFIPQSDLDGLLLQSGLHATQTVEKLSGGQKQLLAFVMGYQSAGNIFLLDEPTAALDQVNTAFLMNAISGLARTKNLVIIMITHDYNNIMQYCTGKHYKIIKDQNGIRSFVSLG